MPVMDMVEAGCAADPGDSIPSLIVADHGIFAQPHRQKASRRSQRTCRWRRRRISAAYWGHCRGGRNRAALRAADRTSAVFRGIARREQRRRCSSPVGKTCAGKGYAVALSVPLSTSGKSMLIPDVFRLGGAVFGKRRCIIFALFPCEALSLSERGCPGFDRQSLIVSTPSCAVWRLVNPDTLKIQMALTAIETRCV